MMQRLARLPCLNLDHITEALARPFSTASAVLGKQLPPRPKPPPDSDIEESYLKGSGPGGQKIVRPTAVPRLKLFQAC